MYLFVNPKQKTGYGSIVVSISDFLPAVWRRKLPLLSPGLRRAYKQGDRGEGAYIRSKKSVSKQATVLFYFTRILNLQNVVEIRILITMQARSRVLSRIYCLEEKCRVAEGGSGGMAPRKFFEMNMRWDTICCIFGDNLNKCYSGTVF